MFKLSRLQGAKSKILPTNLKFQFLISDNLIYNARFILVQWDAIRLLNARSWVQTRYLHFVPCIYMLLSYKNYIISNNLVKRIVRGGLKLMIYIKLRTRIKLFKYHIKNLTIYCSFFNEEVDIII